MKSNSMKWSQWELFIIQRCQIMKGCHCSKDHWDVDNMSFPIVHIQDKELYALQRHKRDIRARINVSLLWKKEWQCGLHNRFPTPPKVDITLPHWILFSFIRFYHHSSSLVVYSWKKSLLQMLECCCHKEFVFIQCPNHMIFGLTYIPQNITFTLNKIFQVKHSPTPTFFSNLFRLTILE